MKLKGVLAILAATFLVGCSGPDIEVIVQHGERGASQIVQDIPHVIIRSRDEKPLTVRSILINNSEDCQSILGMPMPSPFPVTLKLGEIVSVISACEPVKVAVTTDRGEVSFNIR